MYICKWQITAKQVNYVVQEAIVVIRDIFRKYPGKPFGLLSPISSREIHSFATPKGFFMLFPLKDAS